MAHQIVILLLLFIFVAVGKCCEVKPEMQVVPVNS